MRKNRIGGLFPLGLGCVLPVFVLAGTADGVMIQYQFSGVVLEVRDLGHELDGIVQVGDPYAAVFTFDTDTPDRFPGDPSIGNYVGPSATLVMPNINVQTTSCLFVDDDMLYHDENTIDALRFGGSSETHSRFYFDVNFQDPTATCLIDDMLPSISMIETFGGSSWFIGHLGLSSFSGSVLIPEPGALSLLFAGMIGLWMRRMNRQ